MQVTTRMRSVPRCRSCPVRAALTTMQSSTLTRRTTIASMSKDSTRTSTRTFDRFSVNTTSSFKPNIDIYLFYFCIFIILYCIFNNIVPPNIFTVSHTPLRKLGFGCPQLLTSDQQFITQSNNILSGKQYILFIL